MCAILFLHIRIYWHVSAFLLDTILPDCGSAAIFNKAKKNMDHWWEGSTYTAISPTSGSEQENKIGGITFEATLLRVLYAGSCLLLMKMHSQQW